MIVYNNESGGEGLISMAYPGEGIIPAVFIGNHGGEKLRNRIAEGHNQVRFTGEEIPVIGAMSSFTSWGTTPNLDFKPDITAPGGNIYSTIPGDQYEVMSGTSMSSPQVAGGVALILQRMEAEPEMFSQHLNGINRVNMAGHLLMSTARPQEVSEGVEVSPRRQGAGVMDLYAATTTGAIVTDSKTGLSKVNLREIGNTANFSVRVTNFADKERKLRVSGTVLTSYPYVSEGMTYINTNKEQVVLDSGTGSMPISFSGTADGTITVPAGSTADIPVKLDLANPVCMLDDLDKGDSSLKDLNSIFPNGTFVEGFIRLTDLEEKQPELSIPYIGFYGEWDKAPIFDDSLYDEESEPFFGTVIDQKLRGTFVISGDKILGYNNNQMDAQWIAISPNGDEIQDEAQIVTELLRNAREIDVDILDAEGRKLRDLDTIEYLKKNFNLSICEPLYIFPWDGKIDGEVTDGPYIYRLQARVDWDDAKWQTLEFPVRVDTVPPVIESVDYNKDTGSIAVQASDEVFPGVLYHLYVEPRGVLASSIDGVFDLNALAEVPYQLRVMVTDMAGNFSLSEPLTTGTDDKKPVVHLQLPEPRGFYNNQKVTVKGYVEEDNLLASLKLDGNETDFSYNKEENRFEFETTLTIPEGVHDLNIEALDNAGNYSTYQRKLFVDITAPVIQVTTRPPTVVSSGTESVSLAAVIDENMGTLAVIMNGNVLYHKEASPDFESAVLTPVHFEMPLQTVLLEYGDNNILLLAEDGAGNITVRELHVKRMRPEEEQNSGSGGGPGGGSPREEDGSVSGGSTVTVSPGQHGTVSTEGARADVPAAAVGEQVQISVRKLSSTQNLPQRDRLLSGVFEFSKDKSGKFLQPVTIRLAFDRNRIDRERYEPVLCWLDEIRQQWVEVEDCNFDWDNGEVIGRVDHFTKFAVLIRPLVRGVELTDIQGHWARESIEKMINQKVISGYSDGRFLPDKWISRAEFCTILVKYLAVENGFEQPMASFTDTEHHWAKSYIEAAHKAGIVQGYNARTFGPDDPVTREQMTVMLGKAFNIQASDVALTFSDNEKIALWAYPYVAAAVHDKLISGYPDGSFRPQGNTTRAEAVTVLARGMK